jgi:glutathione S-transferase
MGKLPSIIPFDSLKGRKWLAEMRQKGLSIESVPVESPEGQKRLEQFRKLNVLRSR